MSGCLRGVPRPGHWLEGGQASGGQATGCQATGGQAHRPVRGPGGGGRGGAHLGASQEEAGIGMKGQGQEAETGGIEPRNFMWSLTPSQKSHFLQSLSLSSDHF